MVLILRQIWALSIKNFLIVLIRHWASTPFRAFFLPVIFIGFLSYARFLFLPAATYGISSSYPIRTLPGAVSAAKGGRDKLVFVNNGFDGGEIDDVIARVTAPLATSDVQIINLSDEAALRQVCRNTILGASSCIAAAVFYSSPTEGADGIWNTSIRADGALGTVIDVDNDDNDQQIYIMPLQHAIDRAISESNSSATVIPETIENYPYTSITSEQRQKNIRTRYMGGIIDILAVAFYIGMVGISYQLTGLVAKEREIGMAQLLDSMMPNKARWQPQAVRILSHHISFDLMYLPGWIVMSIILSVGVFAETSAAIMLFFNILAGMATASFSLFAASFFQKAQLSGISTTIVFMLLAVVAQIVNKSGTASYTILSLLFPPMNYVFFIITMARWERQELGMNMVQAAPKHTSALPGIVFWIFAVVQIVVYPILGAWLEGTLYGTASKDRKTTVSDSDIAISIEGFSKMYRPRFLTRWTSTVFRQPVKTVLAVDDLNLVARRGEIMVYLGANGSGKSTTLDAIAGLTQISSGNITVNYPDQQTSLGLCPQKNVLWDDMTVLEHVQIMNKIKSDGKPATKRESRLLLESCDIVTKESAQSRTLSGGQKRKLQLAMMFTGGSTICCVDEVSSGLDPLSRRKIWDILLAERGRRSIILTTHFLDEADLLADHIAVLSKGVLKAYGTSVELKSKLGDGYRIHVFHREGEEESKVYDLPHVKYGDQTEYLLQASAEASRFVQQLEKDGITEYQISGPTIEDVFLKLAEEAQSPVEVQNHEVESKEELSRSPSPEHAKVAVVSSQALRRSNINAVPELLTGKRISMWKQATVLFRKRLLVGRRNPLPLLAALLIPIIAAGLVTLFLSGYQLPSCSPQAIDSVSDITSLSSQVNYQLLAGPSSRLTPQVLQEFAATLSAGGASGSQNATELLNAITIVDTLQEFNHEIDVHFANYTPGGFFLGENGAAPTLAWRGDGASISNAQIVLNMLDNILSGMPISSRYQAFDVPWPTDAGKALQMITYFGLCLSIAPAFFALYPTLERLRNVRSLLYSNGVRALPLWLAYSSFDFIIVLLFSAISTIIFATVTSVWYNISYLFVVFFLYGLASIMLSYVISLFSRSQLAAWSIAAAGQAIMFLLYFIAYMSILTYVGAADQPRIINIAHFTIAAIAPICNVQRALFVALNVFSITCHNQQLAPYPGEITVYGGPILYLTLQTLFLFGVLLWWDSGSLYRRLRNKKLQAEMEEKDTTEVEVSDELTRVASSRDGLRVLHLSKHFKKNLAVNDITFGVPRGEVFALLGPNGAGKSTCISLIRGDIQPSRHGGDVLVEDISVISHRAQARSRLGVCPQFDAMDTMTVLEHLDFYARVRGVSDPKHNANAVMQAVGLTQYADRMAAKLSGGNKRKLSLGIALMGNPAVLLLDEPSSGMDAASKRVMWRTLASVIPGRSLVLTTHSMEEADALANRAGIMASKMLALGTTDYLRRKHGDSYYVHLVHRDAPHTSNEDMDRIRGWILRRMAHAKVEQATYHGQLRFEVPTTAPQTEKQDPGTVSINQNMGKREMEDVIAIKAKEKMSSSSATSATSISELFAALESAKQELGIEYYSVSRATLDQVFLNIVRKHNVAEEGAEDAAHGGGEEPREPGKKTWGLRSRLPFSGR